ncbi:alpha/beta hydrolase [Rhizobium rhizogenes]|uniref:Phospholipase/Carboxylesterase n=1 Tax=Rhizobium rhizogenes (strain K84 / ATCC BAA-868) TaxID=311403 RepID=B9JQ46_RHIR8|nr:prolyl oligopeptidase family serine peptidase [Rhizobium rhizogenes]ACM31265.1 Phospholipase/Carboxylesterase [Rhizobium rhizogenes K84]NTI46213.1 prolyl oligopeptidase family serine peptidase [Rhizobium rhizogenes]
MSALAANMLVIMLHGVGSSGSDLAPLANTWKDSLPGAVFASPNAPSRSSFGSGYQWFSVAGVTEDNRSTRIIEARTAFDTTISAIIEENGFSDRLNRVVFVGFSQGTIMALDAIASGRWPVGAVVGFSGRLASPLPLQAAVSTPVLLVHGSADAVIPAAETTKAAALLQSQGVNVETMMIPALGHTISANGAARGATFLASAMAK